MQDCQRVPDLSCARYLSLDFASAIMFAALSDTSFELDLFTGRVHADHIAQSDKRFDTFLSMAEDVV